MRCTNDMQKICTFVNDVRPEKVSLLGPEAVYSNRGWAYPDRSQSTRAASSSCLFWIGDFHPRTDITQFASIDITDICGNSRAEWIDK